MQRKCSSMHFQRLENALQRKNATTLFSLSLVFPNRVTNTNTLIIDIPSTEKSRQTNHASHIRSFVQLQNVSSQLYTSSCTQLKKCCFAKSDLSFRVLSRRSTNRHIARTRPQWCHISRCSPLNCPQNAHYGKPLKIT